MRKTKAFTLIEVMVVMAIIAVLAVLIIGAIQLARRTATETTHRSNAKSIQTGMEGFYAKSKQYYSTGDVVVGCSTVISTTAGDGKLEVALASGASTQNSCAGAGIAAGGCSVKATVAGYTITPYTYNCSGPLGTSDVLSQ